MIKLAGNLIPALPSLRLVPAIREGANRSANNNPRDVALYMESGADCIVGKDVLCSVMGRGMSAPSSLSTFAS